MCSDVVERHLRHVVHDRVGDVGDEALDLQLGDDLLEHAALGLALGLPLSSSGTVTSTFSSRLTRAKSTWSTSMPEVVVLHFLHEHLLALAVEARGRTGARRGSRWLTSSFFGSVTGTTASLWP